jgi:hypothetical protein
VGVVFLSKLRLFPFPSRETFELYGNPVKALGRLKP